MCKHWVLNRVLLGQTVQITGDKLGEDYLVTVTGGHKPHIGSVSTALPVDRLNQVGQTVTVSTFVYPGHKDNHIGNRFAEVIAKRLGQKVVVICGVHFDDVSSLEIEKILESFDNLLAIFMDMVLEGVCD